MGKFGSLSSLPSSYITSFVIALNTFLKKKKKRVLNPNTGALYIHQMKKFQDEDLTPCSSNSSETILAPGRRCGLVVQRANSFTGGRAFDPPL